MSMLIGMLLKFSKHIFFGSFLFVYLLSYYKLMTTSINLYQSTIPNKYVFYFGIVIYLIHLIVLFLVFKIQFQKSVFNSIIWASLIHVILLFVLGGIAYLIFQTNFILFDIDMKALTSEMNYDLKFKNINRDMKFSTQELLETKKALNIYFYLLVLLLLIDSLALYKIFKNI